MELSLWGQIGALIGAALGYLNFRVIIGILEPRLRATDKSGTAEERGSFERKIVLLRRIFFTFEVVVLGAVGYFVGSLFGG
ncbi:MAG: hypothetical protein IT539_15270 [Bradyrhizobiaceae bacterium]|nr:hypothetical protein [Bradyrhizobiaceae bacterium]